RRTEEAALDAGCRHESFQTIYSSVDTSVLPSFGSPARSSWLGTGRSIRRLSSGRSGCLPGVHARPGPPGRPHATLYSWLRLRGLRSSIASTRFPAGKASSSGQGQAPEDRMGVRSSAGAISRAVRSRAEHRIVGTECDAARRLSNAPHTYSGSSLHTYSAAAAKP